MVSLLKSAGLAVQALTPPSLSSTDREIDVATPSVEQQKQAFSVATTNYFRRLYSLDVGLRTHIQALEDEKIISAEAATRDQTSIATSSRHTFPGGPVAAAKPTAVGRNTISGGGLGNLDVGWLNSRNDYVGKNMEAELFKKASDFLAGLKFQKAQDGMGEDLDAVGLD